MATATPPGAPRPTREEMGERENKEAMKMLVRKEIGEDMYTKYTRIAEDFREKMRRGEMGEDEVDEKLWETFLKMREQCVFEEVKKEFPDHEEWVREKIREKYLHTLEWGLKRLRSEAKQKRPREEPEAEEDTPAPPPAKRAASAVSEVL